EEWERERKLKSDPRITRVGRFLRRTSLDELPQLWNVLRGDMSLVGPRPIVDDEIIYYADKFELYKRVHPGITGLWQVSGRNDVTYAERVNLDAYYVRNWSVWLDIYILLRTIWVVMIGDGAY
ncbi:MAG: sugar transferase, partial [Cyanobacteria bacterium P01_H01_bin.153]